MHGPYHVDDSRGKDFTDAGSDKERCINKQKSLFFSPSHHIHFSFTHHQPCSRPNWQKPRLLTSFKMVHKSLILVFRPFWRVCLFFSLLFLSNYQRTSNGRPTDANFECNEEGINLKAMDNPHVALVAVKLFANRFKRCRCDRPMPLGGNLTSLSKVLKYAKDDVEGCGWWS